jgi:hypothetical protein
MSRLDDLPPDQHAALGLLLRQRKSYAEVAELLGIRQIAIHDRVHAALAVLAPQQARMLTAPRREEIGNFLLGQETDEQRLEATRAFLAGSEEGRAWARAVASELAPLSDHPLTELPDEGSPAPAEQDTRELAPAAHGEDKGEEPAHGEDGTATEPGAEAEGDGEKPTPAPLGGSARGARARGARQERPTRRRDLPPRDPAQRSAVPPKLEARTSRSGSRRAGALLLGLIVVAVIVAVVLITRSGSHSEPTKTSAVVSSSSSTSATSSSATSTASTTSSTSTRSGGPKTENRFALASHEAGSEASATVEILSEDGKHAFYITAKNLPPSSGFFYAVWLYNSPTESRGLGRAPAVGSSGRLEGGLLLPSDASHYHEMLLTKETTTTPTKPGPIVLSGPFSLH